jgi:hypothetical protein
MYVASGRSPPKMNGMAVHSVKMICPARFRNFSDLAKEPGASASLCKYVAVTTDFVSRIVRHVVYNRMRIASVAEDCLTHNIRLDAKEK